MEYLLGAIIITQFLYLLYQDRANRQERKRLQFLLKSTDVTEYQTATEIPKKEKKNKPKPNPYIPPEEATTEQILKAIDKT